MKYVSLSEPGDRRLSFYLSMEEYVARRLLEKGKTDHLFFMWQVRPTVIIGRHQLLENEVDMGYCREHGIDVCRRKSGGGCVYADEQNLMLSYVTTEEDVPFTFNRFMNMILLVLRKLGVNAVGTAHNDVLIGDRKVSGTAFYHLPGRSIVHATLLYDTNMNHMLHAITPGEEKLRQKGIQSVRQRITLLKDHIPQSLEELKQHVRSVLCQGEVVLSASDIAAIERMEQASWPSQSSRLIV